MIDAITIPKLCNHLCNHLNYCIYNKGHKGKHHWHNSLDGLKWKYCECDY